MATPEASSNGDTGRGRVWRVDHSEPKESTDTSNKNTGGKTPTMILGITAKNHHDLSIYQASCK
jgi:hypothetical protein